MPEIYRFLSCVVCDKLNSITTLFCLFRLKGVILGLSQSVLVRRMVSDGLSESVCLARAAWLDFAGLFMSQHSNWAGQEVLISDRVMLQRYCSAKQSKTEPDTDSSTSYILYSGLMMIMTTHERYLFFGFTRYYTIFQVLIRLSHDTCDISDLVKMRVNTRKCDISVQFVKSP